MKLTAAAALVLAAMPAVAPAQRADEDVMAQALNAFGSTIGRQSIGLYTLGNARGFSPVQAGNLRIEGLYFDQGANYSGLPARVIRSSSVSVGITALAYPFAAPTGIVDYQLRAPGQTAVLSELVGYASYGQAYDEIDAELPIAPQVLSLGAGIGYTRNPNYDGADRSEEWTGGWIARWQPSDNVQVTPFWDITNHREHGEKPAEFIDTNGIPRYFPISKVGQAWSNFGSLSSNFGAIVHISWPRQWQLSAGLFRSLQYYPAGDQAIISGMDRFNRGEYFITHFPSDSSGATSGELRLSRIFRAASLRGEVITRLTIRDSNIQAAPGDTESFGEATITAIPQYPRPAFSFSPSPDIRVRQYTPGIALEGDWHRVRMTLSAQRVFYHRDVDVPSGPEVSSSSAPWLYHGAAAVSVTRKLLAYASYTQGFEEIGTAPLNAVNRYEPAPAQFSQQVDAGMEYQLLSNLQLIGSVFSIEKPYFSVDELDVFRRLGQMRNRGLELSLAGNLTGQLHIVSGVALIRSNVSYEGGRAGRPTDAVAIGPVPGYATTALEYRLARIKGLALGASVNVYSSRYAVYPDVELPPVTTANAQIRYQQRLFGHEATMLFEGYNLSDAYMLVPSRGNQYHMGDARRYELSLEVDL